MCNPPSQPSITVNLATEASQLLLSKTWALLFHPQYFIHLLLQGHGCPPPLSPPFPHINIHSTHTHTPRSHPTANKGLMSSSIAITQGLILWAEPGDSYRPSSSSSEELLFFSEVGRPMAGSGSEIALQPSTTFVFFLHFCFSFFAKIDWL